jgi:hypothetical protein
MTRNLGFENERKMNAKDNRKCLFKRTLVCNEITRWRGKNKGSKALPGKKPFSADLDETSATSSDHDLRQDAKNISSSE